MSQYRLHNFDLTLKFGFWDCNGDGFPLKCQRRRNPPEPHLKILFRFVHFWLLVYLAC